ncbi:acyltransferase family protein [Nonomuraea sp. LPB2021202275-12-8]|uniref:acyltransferase family protein n=1 Tax=Nonomuraea sp. LPB2021202275-12-8 TaxID=3120159 RepID=UPI00300D5EB3
MTAHPPPQVAARPERRPELDALRTLVVVGLVFFHSSLVFDARDDYYVKNAETTEITMIIAALCVVWAMPLLFLVAGLGSWHSLRHRGAGGFAVERLRRLGVPLVFATIVLLPFPQWLRLKADPAYQDSYAQFWPHFFEVRLDVTEFPFVIQGTYYETGHLWFVVLLLVYSLLIAAARVPGGLAPRVRDGLGALARRRGLVLLAPAIPLALISALLGLEEAYAGWSRWAYLLFFLYGFALASDTRLRDAMRRDAMAAAVIGGALIAAGVPLFLIAGEAPGADAFMDLSPLATLARTMYGAAGWCWVVAILGLLDRRRPAPPSNAQDGRGRRVYGYLAASVLPVYILHQPVVVAVAYVVVGWSAPIAVKYVIIVAASLALTFVAYDLLVRRTPVTRFLFGMR